MSQAPAYNRTTDFADDEANNRGGRSTVATADVDAELDAISESINALRSNVSLNQRDDGEIRDQRVKVFSLAPDVLQLFVTYGASPRGAWVTTTSYALKDIVTQSTNTYFCAVAHTSGVFATDLAAGRWILLALGSAVGAAAVTFTPTATIAAANVQAAIDESDTENRALSAAASSAVASLTSTLADGTSAANGTAKIKHYGPYAVAYLKTLSAILNGERFNLLMAMPEAQRAAIQAYTSTYDCLADINSVLTDMDTAKRGDLYVGDGLFNVSAAITALGRNMRISGSTRRGSGTGTSSFRGSIFRATANTGIFGMSLGALSTVDVELAHLFFLGTGLGTTDALSFTNASGVKVDSCYINNFTRRGIAVSGGANTRVADSQIAIVAAGESCIWIDGDLCEISSVRCSGGQYGVNATSNATNLGVNGHTVIEGATAAGIHTSGARSSIAGTTRISGNTSGAKGILLNAAGGKINGVTVYLPVGGGATNGFGIDLGTSASDYAISGNYVVADTALRLQEGGGTASGNVLRGVRAGAELIAGAQVGVLSDNSISGSTNSVLHTSGSDKWIVSDSNRFDDGAGAFKAMTVTAGTPIATLFGQVAYDPPNINSGASAGTTVTVTGAALGARDEASVTFSLDLQGIQITSYVASANTVGVRLWNGTGGALDLAAGTLYARVRRRQV